MTHEARARLVSNGFQMYNDVAAECMSTSGLVDSEKVSQVLQAMLVAELHEVKCELEADRLNL